MRDLSAMTAHPVPSPGKTGELPSAGAPIVTTMGTGATDSRHLRAIGIRAYGLSVSPVTRTACCLNPMNGMKPEPEALRQSSQ